jgi:hypothetical protein
MRASGTRRIGGVSPLAGTEAKRTVPAIRKYAERAAQVKSSGRAVSLLILEKEQKVGMRPPARTGGGVDE